MKGLMVDSGRVAQLAGGVTMTGDDLAKEIGTMTGILDELRGGWQSSSAAPRFAAVMQGHLDQVVILKDALLSHGASLITVGSSFDEAETALAGGLQGG